MGDAKSAQERLDAESAMDLSSELKVGPIPRIPASRMFSVFGGPLGDGMVCTCFISTYTLVLCASSKYLNLSTHAPNIWQGARTAYFDALDDGEEVEEKKFTYAWCLIHQKSRDDITAGIKV